MTIVNLMGVAALAAASFTATAPVSQAAPTLSTPMSAVELNSQAGTITAAAYPVQGPGAAVIVVRGGRVVYSAGRGLADLETGQPITPHTAFRLGSITKQFTAAVVLQLVQEGQVSLDDPLSRFFPDWPQPGARATVRQLLNHSSGLQDYTKIPGYMLSQPTLRPNSTADLVAVIRSRPSPSEPGSRWEYNNGGYAMLGAIIEKVTGKAWHEIVTERIARPLGLKTLAYADMAAPGSGVARGYSEAEGKQVPARGVHISVAHAAGGLAASATDLAKWAQALHGGRVVSPVLYQQMIKPAQLTDGSTQPYGFGLRIQKIRGRAALVHGGAGRGLDTDSVYIPSGNLFVAVLANSDDPAMDPSIVARRLAALALGQPYPSFDRAVSDMNAIQPLLGAYGAEPGAQWRFFSRDDKLYLGRGDDEMEAFAAGQDRFFFGPQRLMWFSIARMAGGAHVMELHNPEAAAPVRTTRIGPVPAALTVSNAKLQSYVGTFQTETVTMTIAMAANGALTVAPGGQRALSMRPVTDTEFRIEGGMMRIVFHPENGQVDRLTIYRGARELHGRRVVPGAAGPEVRPKD